MIMTSLSEFFDSPSEEFLEGCSKEQLFEIGKHYGVEIDGRRSKENVKSILVANLVEKDILHSSVGEITAKPTVLPPGLTFEQHRELLLLQFEHDKFKMKVQLEAEHTRLEIERTRLDLAKQSVASGVSRSSSVASEAVDMEFDVIGNLRLLPKFNELDPDSFFVICERVAEARSWSDSARVLLLQCVLVGRAQEVFSALSDSDCHDYAKVKAAVLKTYELVPEAYRQRFRSCRKNSEQSYLEFARDIKMHFMRWCAAAEVKTFEQLGELVVLEQLKNSVPEVVATYICEQKAQTAAAAAALADDYVLTHKSQFPAVSGFRGDIGRSDSSRRPAGLRKVEVKPPGSFDSNDRCNYCHKRGHWKADCHLFKSRTPTFQSRPEGAGLAAPVFTGVEKRKESPLVESVESYLPFIRDGYVSLEKGEKKIPVKVLRDTGAFNSFIQADVLPLPEHAETDNCIPVRDMGLNILLVPLHRVFLECQLFCGEALLAVRPALPIDGVSVILGNDLAGSSMWTDESPTPSVGSEPESQNLDRQEENERELSNVFTACAVTRAMSRSQVNGDKDAQEENKDYKSFLPLADFPFPVTSTDLITDQRADSSLKELFQQVRPEGAVSDHEGAYFLRNSVLMRRWVPYFGSVEHAVFQVVVPSKYREALLKVAHDDSGHAGVKKTYDRVLRHFFWPRLKRDISSYVRTCHVCQLTAKPNQPLKPTPLLPIPVATEPFEHLIIDCVGPLPRSRSGACYLLTVMCQSTRYPAAYPLRTITAKSVVRALSQFISVFGIPQTIQSDQGTNFSSRLFGQVLKQLRVKHNRSTAYHAESQGALERFHQTLKSLLRAYCIELGKDWEDGLPWLMLAAREVTQESIGFSPNELVFGHTVKGPLAAVAAEWKEPEPPQNLIDYVNGFRHRLYAARNLAKEKLSVSQHKMKSLFDRRAVERSFLPGDQVLALCPIISSPFQAKFSGPYTVLKRLSDQNYLIATPERRKTTQLCHVNLLKPYYARDQVKKSPEDIHPVCAVNEVCMATCSNEETGTLDSAMTHGRLSNSESLQKLDVLLSHLSEHHSKQLSELIYSFPGLFSDTPGRTTWLEHDIDVGQVSPIKQHFYRVNMEKRKCLDAEVKYMLDNGIAEPSSSSWASPCILVPKPDNTFRFCSDYRKLNAVTKPDSFPLPRMDDCVDQVGSAKFVSRFDLLKGYWQVPLTKRAQELAAFVTPSGLYSYTVMPFGLRNAPATFQRLMNYVVGDMPGCAVYLDDVVIYSDTWEQHMERIHDLFTRLSVAGLTINLAKCEFAKATVTYLGHVVGQGQVRPVAAKVQAVLNFPVPVTKKDLMRFLGLVSYYRCFCKNFSSVVAPLTNLLSKDAKFDWSPSCQHAFEQVKQLLCCAPVLAAPRLSVPFQLHVDASYVGAGAVLTQIDDQGNCKPVSYFSKKFNKHQLNYSVIEKETLALILALQHFVYLGGGAPIVVYTDHNPLTFLTTLKCPNQRLVRWLLFLQSFSLDIRYIKGRDNVVADALSRAPVL
ncbi:uncharacterized protein LOC111608951 [Xiphophorus maculatus]|uniref:Gypsy retrotransposon integrase-like protein 1 n=1 Tax=Xiphophorus maculatus TaxID=8083 RepID=A0A3B5Q2L5_XIPMA|nr:uncharacterized protein LOC111608951 [Xiphophorus maculatus]